MTSETVRVPAVPLASSQGDAEAAVPAEELDALSAQIDALVADADVPAGFPTGVLSAATESAQRIAAPDEERIDLRGVPFFTIDPAGSTDLDQAMHLAPRDGGGWTVLYAIADVPFFVDLDGPIDAEARQRTATVYLPDRRIPLHPTVLGEDAASLLPERDRPAFVWTIELDADGAVEEVDLVRALVRSRAQLDYRTVQSALDDGTAEERIVLLTEIGAARRAQEHARGGASLSTPEQEVRREDGTVVLTWRTPEPVEDDNAQISLLTGMCAARIMLDGEVGVLRTMPAADERAVARFRRQAAALGVPWPEGQLYGDFLRTLSWREPNHLALLNQATTLFRGAGYEAFDGAPPELATQSAIAAPYAHATAPLRRLVDRFVLLVCWRLTAGREVPADLRAALSELPSLMGSTRGSAVERRAVDRVELVVLEPLVGQEFTGTVVEVRDGRPAGNGNPASSDRVEVQLLDPPLAVWAEGRAGPGDSVRIRLIAVDRERGRYTCELV